MGKDVLCCHSGDCTCGSWSNNISSLLRGKFVLRPSTKAQVSDEKLRQVINCDKAEFNFLHETV